MPDGIVGGFLQIPAATGGAGPMLDDYPWRFVFHSTEIPQFDPRSWVPRWSSPSQFVLDYERDLAIQTMSLLNAGKALENRPGGVETNRMPAIQVEIQGRADEAGSWSDDKLRWIARKMAEIWKEAKSLGHVINLDPNTVPLPGPHGGSASVDAVQRLSFQQWLNLPSGCGHRHVPENEHYDADQLDMRKIFVYIKQELDGQSISPPLDPNDNGITDHLEIDYMYTALRPSSGDILLVNLATGNVENLLTEVMPRLAPLGVTASQWQAHLKNLRDAGVLVKGSAGPEFLWSNITDDVWVTITQDDKVT